MARLINVILSVERDLVRAANTLARLRTQLERFTQIPQAAPVAVKYERFVAQQLLRVPGEAVGSTDLFNAFSLWAAAHGMEIGSHTCFGRSLRALGLGKGKREGIIIYRDVVLKGNENG
jgi:hypothetical protein